MSPKIAFALLLLGCGLLGLANAERYISRQQQWINPRNPYQTRRIPVGPGSQGNECNCPCGEMNDYGGISDGVRTPGIITSPEIFDSSEDDDIGVNEVSTYEKDYRPRQQRG